MFEIEVEPYVYRPRRWIPLWFKNLALKLCELIPTGLPGMPRGKAFRLHGRLFCSRRRMNSKEIGETRQMGEQAAKLFKG